MQQHIANARRNARRFPVKAADLLRLLMVFPFWIGYANDKEAVILHVYIEAVRLQKRFRYLLPAATANLDENAAPAMAGPQSLHARVRVPQAG